RRLRSYFSMLTLRERALIFRACWEHPVASCARCRRSFRSVELAGHISRALSTLCPTCRLDLTDSMREHLIACVVAAGLDAQNVRAEAKALVEATTALRKEARQHRDAATGSRRHVGRQNEPDLDRSGEGRHRANSRARDSTARQRRSVGRRGRAFCETFQRHASVEKPLAIRHAWDRMTRRGAATVCHR